MNTTRIYTFIFFCNSMDFSFYLRVCMFVLYVVVDCVAISFLHCSLLLEVCTGDGDGGSGDGGGCALLVVNVFDIHLHSCLSLLLFFASDILLPHLITIVTSTPLLPIHLSNIIYYSCKTHTQFLPHLTPWLTSTTLSLLPTSFHPTYALQVPLSPACPLGCNSLVCKLSV